MNTEEIINPNGLGLASVRKNIKSESLVRLQVWFSRDLDDNKDYNFEYSVINELFHGRTSTYSKYYNGDGIENAAEKKYQEELQLNKYLIGKVKIFLDSPSEAGAQPG